MHACRLVMLKLWGRCVLYTQGIMQDRASGSQANEKGPRRLTAASDATGQETTSHPPACRHSPGKDGVEVGVWQVLLHAEGAVEASEQTLRAAAAADRLRGRRCALCCHASTLGRGPPALAGDGDMAVLYSDLLHASGHTSLSIAGIFEIPPSGLEGKIVMRKCSNS